MIQEKEEKKIEELKLKLNIDINNRQKVRFIGKLKWMTQI